MPSPIGHTLISFGAYLFYKKKGEPLLRHWKLILFVIFIGGLPDADYILGLLVGSPKRFHATYTHTLGFAVMVGFLVWVVAKIMHRERPLRLAIFSFILLFIHLLADIFNYDSRPPVGVMLFWPITSRYFYMPVRIFYPSYGFSLKQIFSIRSLVALITELSVGLPFILIGYVWSSGKNRWKLLFGICVAVVIFIVFTYIASITIRGEKKPPKIILYEAEDMLHKIGLVVDDKEAINGKALYTEEEGSLVYGPYAKFPCGEYIVSFTLKGKGKAVIESVSDGGKTVLARKKVSVRDNYRKFRLRFFLQKQRELEFRVKCMQSTKLWADRIDLEFYVWREEPEDEYLGKLNGEIVFSSDSSGARQIYSMDANGEGLVKLTTGPGENFYPRWGLDGKSIVFTSTRDGNEEIYVMDIETGNQRRLTDHPAEDKQPAWVYGAEQIVFCSNRDGADNIYIINSDGKGLLKVTDFASGQRGYPSSDGERVVFSEDTILGWQIFSLDIDSKRIDRLTGPPYGHCDPSLSVDGTKIVFARRLAIGDSTIWIMDSNGKGSKECIVDYPTVNYNPRLSPDNKHVVYSSKRDGNWDLYIAGVEGEGDVHLTYTNGHDEWPDWKKTRDNPHIFSPFQ